MSDRTRRMIRESMERAVAMMKAAIEAANKARAEEGRLAEIDFKNRHGWNN